MYDDMNRPVGAILFCVVIVMLFLAYSISEAQMEMDTMTINGAVVGIAPTQPYANCDGLVIEGEDVTQPFVQDRTQFADYIGLGYVIRIDGYAVWTVRSIADDTLLYYVGWWWDVPASKDGYIVGHPSCGVYRVTDATHRMYLAQ